MWKEGAGDCVSCVWTRERVYMVIKTERDFLEM